MGMLRIISKRGDDRLLWNAEDALAGDDQAKVAIQEAERIFAKEQWTCAGERKGEINDVALPATVQPCTRGRHPGHAQAHDRGR